MKLKSIIDVPKPKHAQSLISGCLFTIMAALILATTSFVPPVLAGVDKVMVCHYDDEGSLKVKLLPLKAAEVHYKNHFPDERPNVWTDGTVTCEPEPEPDCPIEINNTSTSDWMFDTPIVDTVANCLVKAYTTEFRVSEVAIEIYDDDILIYDITNPGDVLYLNQELSTESVAACAVVVGCDYYTADLP